MAFGWSLRMTRIRWTSVPTLSRQAQSKSTLSSSATTSLLRSFYLSVHPDFFAQYPKIQKVNESSLKRLNNYLEIVQSSRQVTNLQPTRVSFYFRKQKDRSSENNDFKLVQFTLRSHDLLTNIQHILTSCDLSANHLQDLLRNESKRSEIPLQQRYRRTDYNMQGHNAAFYRDYEKHDLNADFNLRQWLNKNISQCRKEQESSRMILQNIGNLKDDLCMQLGLRKISWCSPWQHLSEQGTLRNFARFCSHHKDQMQCLRGRRLVFTDRTMAGADGSLCLNVEDVTQQWLQFISRFDEKFSRTFVQARQLDDYVHKTCGNIKVIRPKVRLSRFRDHNLVSIDDYVSILTKILTKLKSIELKDDVKILPWSMRNLEMTFVKLQEESVEPSLLMFSNGRFRVDKNSDAVDLLKYLVDNKSLSEEKKYINASNETRSNHLAQLCKEKLGLQSITKDFDVEHRHMADCCERLLQNSSALSISLKDLDIRITAKYFSIFDHGCLCVPWDWKM